MDVSSRESIPERVDSLTPWLGNREKKESALMHWSRLTTVTLIHTQMSL